MSLKMYKSTHFANARTVGPQCPTGWNGGCCNCPVPSLPGNVRICHYSDLCVALVLPLIPGPMGHWGSYLSLVGDWWPTYSAVSKKSAIKRLRNGMGRG